MDGLDHPRSGRGAHVMSETQKFIRQLSGLGLKEYLAVAAPFSFATFGPGCRTTGIVAHLRKELQELSANPDDPSEWADVFILGMDGYWRHADEGRDPAGKSWHFVDEYGLERLMVMGAGGFYGLHDRRSHLKPAMETFLANIETAFSSRDAGSNTFFDLRRNFMDIAMHAAACAPTVLEIGWPRFRSAIWDKLEVNMGREWPDWRDVSGDET
jgi:hypothetical protein